MTGRGGAPRPAPMARGQAGPAIPAAEPMAGVRADAGPGTAAERLVRTEPDQRSAYSSAMPANTAIPTQWLCRKARKQASRSR